MIGKNYRYFLTIAETGSITKAAKTNYVSQPSMTQYLNRLEASLGVKLFDRRQTPLVLTQAGEIYRDFVEEYIRLESDLESRLNQLRGSVHGEMNIGIPIQMQPVLVPRFLAPFLLRYPDVQVSIRLDAPSPSIQRRVSSHVLDCALVYLSDARDARLTYFYIENEPIYLICSASHPLLAGRKTSKENPFSLPLSDLAAETFCLIDKSFVMRQIPDYFLRQHHFKPQRIITMSSMNAVIDTVRLGREIAFMPNYVIDRYNHADELAYLSVDKTPLSMELALVYPNDIPLSPAAAAFVDFVRESESTAEDNK